MPYTPNTTWVDGSGGGTPLSAARLNNLESGVTWTWDTYTPAWTSSGSAPAIGNGTLSGKYIQRGKWVTGQARLIIGSTSTIGTGSYRLSLPVTAAAASVTVIGSGYTSDASVDSLWTGVVYQAATTYVNLFVTAAAGAYPVGAAAPFAFATSDAIHVQFTYEAA
jgi:hypothetical protein